MLGAGSLGHLGCTELQSSCLPKVAESQLWNCLALLCILANKLLLQLVQECIGDGASSGLVSDDNIACMGWDNGCSPGVGQQNKEWWHTSALPHLGNNLLLWSATVVSLTTARKLTVPVVSHEAEDMAVSCVRKTSVIC